MNQEENPARLETDENNAKDEKKPLDTDRSKRFWNKLEDDLLLNYVTNSNSKNWNLISEYIKTKTPQQCAYRYSKLMSDMNKKKWSRKDDIKLIELVETYGANWEQISKHFDDRTDRDVEFRYKEKLDPNVKNSKFTEEEDTLIIKLHEEYGSKWFEISRQFKNRNAKMIKKRFQSYLKYKCPKLKKCNRLNKLTESNNQNSSQNSRIDQGKENLTRKTTMMVNEHPQLQTAKKNTIIPTIILDNSFNKSNGNSHNRHSNYINLKDDTFNVDMFFEKTKATTIIHLKKSQPINEKLVIITLI